MPNILSHCAVGLFASFVYILRMSGSGYYDLPDSAKPRVEFGQILVCWFTTGLLLAYEETGYDNTKPGRIPDLLDFWSVRRLKEAGADCIKVLIYYTPFDTKAVNDEFEQRDEFVVKDAIASAVRQKRAVTGALFITAILTVFFVLATRRRLKARMEADISAERQRRAELETISVRFGVATRAVRQPAEQKPALRAARTIRAAKAKVRRRAA